MKEGFFLIPTAYCSDGKLPIDYKFTSHKIDRRTRFYRINKTREVSAAVAIYEAERNGLRVFRDESGEVCRILAPNGKAAKAYRDKMAQFGWED